MKKELIDIKQGDNVIRHTRYGGETLEKVTRVTKTQIHIGTLKYRKTDGNRIGKTEWTTDYITPAPDDFQNISLKN